MNGNDLVPRVQEHYSRSLPLGVQWADPEYIYSWRHPIGYYQRERVRRGLVALLNNAHLDMTTGRWLDIGCGTGDWLRFIAELRGDERNVIGLDLSSESLGRGKLINSSLATMLGDARHLPFADQAFDWVSQFVTFEHLLDSNDLECACHEVDRVCKPGGWLVWYDILPVRSEYQRGFTLDEVRHLFPSFHSVASQPIFRNVKLPGRTLSTAYQLARRSYLLADLVERFIPGPANNLMVLLQKNV